MVFSKASLKPVACDSDLTYSALQIKSWTVFTQLQVTRPAGASSPQLTESIQLHRVAAGANISQPLTVQLQQTDPEQKTSYYQKGEHNFMTEGIQMRIWVQACSKPRTYT